MVTVSKNRRAPSHCTAVSIFHMCMKAPKPCLPPSHTLYISQTFHTSLRGCAFPSPPLRVHLPLGHIHSYSGLGSTCDFVQNSYSSDHRLLLHTSLATDHCLVCPPITFSGKTTGPDEQRAAAPPDLVPPCPPSIPWSHQHRTLDTFHRIRLPLPTSSTSKRGLEINPQHTVLACSIILPSQFTPVDLVSCPRLSAGKLHEHLLYTSLIPSYTIPGSCCDRSLPSFFLPPSSSPHLILPLNPLNPLLRFAVEFSSDPNLPVS